MFKVTIKSPTASMPKRTHTTDAGITIQSSENVIIFPGSRQLIDTGVTFEIPDGWYGRLTPNRDMSLKAVDVISDAINSTNRETVKVLLANNSNKLYEVKVGDVIAQVVISKVVLDNPDVKYDLYESKVRSGNE